MRAFAYQPTAGFTSTVINHSASLGLMCGQHVDSPTVVGSLDKDYHYKLVATQILHNAGLALFCTAGNRTRDHCMQGSDYDALW